MSRYVDVGPDRHRAVAGGGAHINLTIGIELEDTGAVCRLPVRIWLVHEEPDRCFCIQYTHRYKLPLRVLSL